MQQRFSLILASTALVIAVFGVTPLGEAAGRVVRSVPPFARTAGYAKRAGVATNALALSQHKASTTASPGAIPVLDGQGKVPAPISLARTAFALVDPNGGNPQLVTAHSSGFVDVRSPYAGVYCLTPAPGVDVASTAAVASEEASRSGALGIVLVRYPAASDLNCRTDQLEVKTSTDNPIELSNRIAFTVIVP